MRFMRVVVPLSMLLGSCGCGSSAPPPFVPAQGTLVDAAGKPIWGMRVDFWPEDDPKGYIDRYDTIPYCISSSGGKIDMLLKTKRGVPPGRYRVTVGAIRPQDKKLIPKRYNTEEETPLQVTIPAEGKTDLLLRLGPS
ncbi:MAG: hypothetical protein U0793_07750 [Gemmataceae bacterium]